MNDLISRRQAVDAICKEWCCCSHDDCKYKNMMENGFDPCDGCSDVDAIMELPSAQPEIIYCRDCTNYIGLFSDGHGKCRIYGDKLFSESDFCSHAEKENR